MLLQRAIEARWHCKVTKEKYKVQLYVTLVFDRGKIDDMSTPKWVSAMSWRHKGGKKPANVVVVTRPSRWGNPFHAKAEGDFKTTEHDAQVTRHAAWIMAPEQAEFRAQIKAQLRGKDLACFCKPGESCHGDVLLRLAND